MILFFDTTGTSLVCSSARSDGRIFCRKKIPDTNKRGTAFFRAVQKILSDQRPEGIVVVVGPGRFSGIRLGVVIGNTLGYAWGIPLMSVIKKTEEESERALLLRGIQQLQRSPKKRVIPMYGEEPRMTILKR